jgi:hypothetical protein
MKTNEGIMTETMEIQIPILTEGILPISEKV